MSHEQTIKLYISEELAPDVDPSSLPSDIDLLSTGIIDSLSLVRLVSWIGDEFDIPVGDIEIAPEDFKSVTRVNDFIGRHSV